MPQPHSKTHKRVETLSVTDEPHERYQMHAPYTGEEIRGIPVLRSTARGKVVAKAVKHQVRTCPDCEVEFRYNQDEEPMCPNCGLLTGGDNRGWDNLVRDSKAAGRVRGESE